MSITMAIKSHTRKGRAARTMSPNVVPGGATPFITNKSMPKGGVDSAISKLRSISTANQICLNELRAVKWRRG